MIKVTQKDALRAEQLTPGWREGTCINHFEKAAATDGSKLDIFEIEVIENGVSFPLKNYQISEKAVSMGKAFFLACGVPQSEWDKLIKGESTGFDLDPRSFVGKKFKVYVKNTTYEGRINNEAGDFLSL